MEDEGGPYKLFPGRLNITGMWLYNISTGKPHQFTYTTDNLLEVAKMLANPNWQLAICHNITYYKVYDEFNVGSIQIEINQLYIPTIDKMVETYLELTTYKSKLPSELMDRALIMMRAKADTYVRAFINKLNKKTSS